MDIIYLNGQFIPKEQANISIMDRGFLFGDGVYEVVPAFDGHMFQTEAHIHRLIKSLEAIQLALPITEKEIKHILKELLIRNHLTDRTVNLYLQITRGPQEHRSHEIPAEPKPTIVAFCMPAKPYAKTELAHGYAAITLEDSRRRDCFIKAIGLLPNILLYDEAKKAGAVEAILIRDGEVMEGTLSNVFLVKDNELYTPPLSMKILNGVTRSLLIKLAHENGIIVHQKKIHEAALSEADEIWMTGSSKEICPITKLNGKSVGSGKVGPMWSRMMDYYEAAKKISQKNASIA